MKRKIFTFLLSLFVFTTIFPLSNNLNTAYALPQNVTELEVIKEAMVLKDLGLFLGNENGFELDKEATRAHSIVMLVRILGEENEALSYTGEHPFTDVPSWCDRYVAYAYNKGYTSGTSTTKYSPNNKITANQYIVLLLRALGYNEKTNDFKYSTAFDKAKEIGLITNKDDYLNDFYRKDIVHISYKTLTTKTKEGILVAEKLAEKNTSEDFKNVLIANELIKKPEPKIVKDVNLFDNLIKESKDDTQEIILQNKSIKNKRINNFPIITKTEYPIFAISSSTNKSNVAIFDCEGYSKLNIFVSSLLSNRIITAFNPETKETLQINTVSSILLQNDEIFSNIKEKITFEDGKKIVSTYGTTLDIYGWNQIGFYTNDKNDISLFLYAGLEK